MSISIARFLPLFLGFLFVNPILAQDINKDNIGAVSRIQGEVIIHRNGTDITLKGGELILPNDFIETGKNGGCLVTFPDESILKLGKLSGFIVKQLDFDETNRIANFNFVKGVMTLKMSQRLSQNDDVRVGIPMGEIIVYSAEVFAGFLEREHLDIALMGLGRIIIKRDGLESVIKIPGFGASFEREGSELVKPKRLTPEKITQIQEATQI